MQVPDLAVENVFAGHFVHDSPTFEAKPAIQSIHSELFGEASVPAGHVLHSEASARDMVLSGHFLHIGEPDSAAKKPGKHSWQRFVPPPADPTGHLIHAPRSGSGTEPFGQGAQAVAPGLRDTCPRGHFRQLLNPDSGLKAPGVQSKQSSSPAPAEPASHGTISSQEL